MNQVIQKCLYTGSGRTKEVIRSASYPYTKYQLPVSMLCLRVDVISTCTYHQLFLLYIDMRSRTENLLYMHTISFFLFFYFPLPFLFFYTPQVLFFSVGLWLFSLSSSV